MARPSGKAQWALAGVLLLAAVNFGWQLGASSYFVDEVLSIQASSHAIGQVLDAVSRTEITPPAYFVFQHAWLAGGGSQTEAWARLPSAVCGIALVAAIFWLAWELTARRAIALGAATLAALSPFVLEYSQRAQGYVFAALAVTVAASCALRAETLAGDDSRRGRRWLTASAGTAAVSLCTNYSAALVVLALTVWVARRPIFPVAWRRTFVIGLGGVQLALLPLFVSQWRATPGRHGVGSGADLSLAHAGRLARAALEGRVDSLPALAVAVVAVALLSLLATRRRAAGAYELILAIAIGEPLLLLLLSAFGARVALPRYAAVAVPFVLVAIAAGLARLPRRLALLGAAAALIVAVAGLLANHQTSGFYPDAHGAIDYIRAGQRPGDAVLSPLSVSVAVPLAYYGARALRPVPPYAFSGSAGARALIAAHRRLWLVVPEPAPTPRPAALLQAEQGVARRVGYRLVSARIFPSMTPLAVVLLSPFARGALG